MKAEEFFTDAPKQAWFKAAIYGAPGTGKTFIGAHLAAHLATLNGESRPVLMLDTESGARFVQDIIEARGAKLLVKASRSFDDLMKALEIADEMHAVFLPDSTTHIWDCVIEDYLRATYPNDKVRRTQLNDWSPIKSIWREFTERMVAARCDVIALGRAGGVFKAVVNERGKREIQEVDTKLRADKEFGHEPNLVLELEQLPSLMEAGLGERNIVHRMHVIKDRTRLIHGKVFDYRPGTDPDDKCVADLMPVINALDRGSTDTALDISRNSEGRFSEEDRTDQRMRVREREAACEEIRNAMAAHLSRQNKTDVAIANATLKWFFRHTAWQTIENNWTAVPLGKLLSAAYPREGAPPNSPSPFEEIIIRAKEAGSFEALMKGEGDAESGPEPART